MGLDGTELLGATLGEILGEVRGSGAIFGGGGGAGSWGLRSSCGGDRLEWRMESIENERGLDEGQGRGEG